ncbi:IQ and CH and CAMSAP CH domain containing protein [Trichuris trichiura]|uniref:IQ and CH and CAMSAP CH domain containing protein n=1 Tax=Trichuris trichiura TaxID=36087 RepID=A0A077ZG41_TRITR|nr:IQ and CH and CAMSAP CH domain containing protein [Trichuris trichiura]
MAGPYSPTHGVAHLELRPFAPPVCLSFGQLMAGHSGDLSFNLLNNENCPCDFLIESFDGNKVRVKVCPCAGSIQSNSSVEISVSWKPAAVGNMRTNLCVRVTTDGDELYEVSAKRYSLRVVLVGSCVMPGEKAVHERGYINIKHKETKARGKILEKMSDASKEKERSADAKYETSQNGILSRSFIAIRASVEIGLGTEQTRKQFTENASVEEHIYKRFLNYILMSDLIEEDHPASEGEIPHVNLKQILASGHSPSLSKGGKVKMTVRQYTTQMKLNRLRHDAQQLFCSLKQMVYRVFQLVEDKKIVIRQEMDIHVDQGLRQLILNVLLSITPLWLRLGLETVFCEILPVTSNSDVRGLAHFILTRMLNDPLILKRYSVAHVRNVFKNGYKEAISKFFMQKLFALLIFLDHAKSKRMIKSDPCLFYRTSKYKSVREVLTVFNKELINANGNILKILASVGYHPVYEQTWYDEKPSLLGNLATDLRDGAMLVRLAGILSGNTNLCSDLRGPPISRLQKVHNVELAIKALTSIGISSNGVDANAIVAGHREKTLGLLWQIICFKLGFPKDPMQSPVFFEIMRLRRYLFRLQNKSEGIVRLLAVPLTSNMSPSDVFIKWIACVCSMFDVEVDNLNLSLFDGRALCCLISYYLPFMLARDNINFETTMCNRGKEFVPYEVLKSNDIRNRNAFLNAVEEIGDVPWLVSFDDLVHINGMGVKNEKVLLLCLNSLASSLLALGRQHQAASVIQQAWRQHRSRHAREKAAIAIQRYWRQQGRHIVFVKRVLALGRLSLAARKIQRSWRFYKKKKGRLLTIAAAEVEAVFELIGRTETQACAHTVSLKLCSAAQLDVQAPSSVTTLASNKDDKEAVSEYKCTNEPQRDNSSLGSFGLKQNELVLLLQSYGRRRLALETYMKELFAACVIQRTWRSYLSRRYARDAVTGLPLSCTPVEFAVEPPPANLRENVQEEDIKNVDPLPGYGRKRTLNNECESSELALLDWRTILLLAKKTAARQMMLLSPVCFHIQLIQVHAKRGTKTETTSPQIVDELILSSPAKKCKLTQSNSDGKEYNVERGIVCNGTQDVLKLLSSPVKDIKQNEPLNLDIFANGEPSGMKDAANGLVSQIDLAHLKSDVTSKNLNGEFGCLVPEFENVMETSQSNVTRISDISYHFDDLPTMSFVTGDFSPGGVPLMPQISQENETNYSSTGPDGSCGETEISTKDESEATTTQSENDSATQNASVTCSLASLQSIGESCGNSVERQSVSITINSKSERSPCEGNLLHSLESSFLPTERTLAGETQNSMLGQGKSLSISTPNYSCDLSTFEKSGNRSSELSLGSLDKCNNVFEEIMKAEGDIRADPHELTCPLGGIVPDAMSVVSETKCRYLVMNNVPEVLYRVIKRLNRGYACMESKTIAVKCLDEIALHVGLRPSIVAPPEWLTCLSDLLLSSKNGNSELFFTVISVLCRVAHLPKAKALVHLNKGITERWLKLKHFFASRAASLEKKYGNRLDNCDGSLPGDVLFARNNCQLGAMNRLLNCYQL